MESLSVSAPRPVHHVGTVQSMQHVQADTRKPMTAPVPNLSAQNGTAAGNRRYMQPPSVSGALPELAEQQCQSPIVSSEKLVIEAANQEQPHLGEPPPAPMPPPPYHEPAAAVAHPPAPPPPPPPPPVLWSASAPIPPSTAIPPPSPAEPPLPPSGRPPPLALPPAATGPAAQLGASLPLAPVSASTSPVMQLSVAQTGQLGAGTGSSLTVTSSASSLARVPAALCDGSHAQPQVSSYS